MKNTKILDTTDENLRYAAQLIKDGMVVGIPTETVYGLGADALNPKAVKAVFTAKGRPADNPLIVHIADISDTERLAEQVPPLFYKLAEKFWSGPLTMIVKKKNIVPDITSGGLDTVALRMPSHPVMQRLIELCGPIAAPSANTSGYPSPTNALHVLHDMNGKIPAVIDGGSSDFGVESTVISFDDESTVRILRPGSVTKEMLETQAPKVIVDKAVLAGVEEGEKVNSPGMKYKHYSPNARLVIIEGTPSQFLDYVRKNAVCYDACLMPLSMKGQDIPCRAVCYGDGAENMACSFYDDLRELDRLGAENVCVFPPEKNGVGLAVYNRLLRAAGFEVICL